MPRLGALSSNTEIATVVDNENTSFTLALTDAGEYIRCTAATEFILEYVEEPADKTGVMSRDEAAAYTKNAKWETGEPLGLNSSGQA